MRNEVYGKILINHFRGVTEKVEKKGGFLMLQENLEYLAKIGELKIWFSDKWNVTVNSGTFVFRDNELPIAVDEAVKRWKYYLS